LKRRDFITLFGGATAWPLAARAQQGERMRRIGVLMGIAADDPAGQVRLAAFLQGLQQLGWTEGRNVRIDIRWGAAQSRTCHGIGRARPGRSFWRHSSAAHLATRHGIPATYRLHHGQVRRFAGITSSRSEVRGIGAMKKQEAAAAVIDTLAEKWPNAFFADPQKRRPLKVGVHLDILEALPGVNKKTLSAPAVLHPTPLLRAGGRQGPGPRRPERRRGRAGERAGQGDGGGRVEEGGAEAGEGGRGEEGR